MSDAQKNSPWRSNDPRQRLHDIVEHGKSILEITKDFDREAFESDTVVLEPTIVERHPDIPWHQVRAIANILRHGYGDVDLDILWDAIAGGELQSLIVAAETDILSA